MGEWVCHSIKQMQHLKIYISSDGMVSMTVALGISVNTMPSLNLTSVVTDGLPHTLFVSLNDLMATIIVDNTETVAMEISDIMNQATPIESPIAISLGGPSKP